jgi:hypothetical protein
MNNHDYDERQQIDRLKAYRIGFWVLVGYVALTPILYYFLKQWAYLYSICYLGIIISCTIIIIYNIFKGSYLRRSDKARKLIICFTICAIIYLFTLISIVKNSELPKSCKEIPLFTILATIIFYIIIAISLFIKEFILNRKHKAEE